MNTCYKQCRSYDSTTGKCQAAHPLEMDAPLGRQCIIERAYHLEPTQQEFRDELSMLVSAALGGLKESPRTLSD